MNGHCNIGFRYSDDTGLFEPEGYQNLSQEEKEAFNG